MKIAFVGPSGCGKDLAAEYLARITCLRYAHSCSALITPHAARRLKQTEAEAFADRHRYKNIWRAIGDELRKDDAAALARVCLASGEILVGVRSRVEMNAVRAHGMVDLIIWIDRPGCEDETLEFGPEMADIVIQNHGSIQCYKSRLKRLALTWGPVGRPAVTGGPDPMTAGRDQFINKGAASDAIA